MKNRPTPRPEILSMYFSALAALAVMGYGIYFLYRVMGAFK